MTAPRIAAALAFTLVLVAVASPLAGGVVAGNRADVDVDAPRSAAASCQVLVLVNAVIVLDLEDGLALLSERARAPATITVPAAASLGSGSFAECRVILDTLRVVFPTHAEAATSRGSYVAGPPPVADEHRVGPGIRVDVTGDGSAAAVCQFVVLVNSVILGGGAFGLPTGPAPHVLTVPAERAGAGGGATASCEALVRNVEVVGAR